MSFFVFAQSLVKKFGATQVLYVFLLGLMPLSRFVFPKVKTRTTALLIHLTYGISMCLFLFQQRILFAIGFALIMFPFLDKKPSFVFAFGFVINSIIHIYHMFFGPKQWSMEITGTCLCIFQKIISVSYNIYDGKQRKLGKKPHEAYEFFALDEKPTILEWFSYCFTAYGGTTGPFYEYRVFIEMITCHERKPIPNDSIHTKKSIQRYLGSFLWAGITLLSFKFANYNSYFSEFYLSKPYIIRNLLMCIYTIFQLVRYFTAWYAVEAGLYQLGICENPSISFDSVSNLSIIDVLKSDSLSAWIQNWNHTTHLFWKKYLFMRIKNAGYGTTIAFYSVFIASAVWHGFRPIYYLFLFDSFIAMMLDKRVRQYNFGNSKYIAITKNVIVVYIMLGATSSWWYSTAESYFYVRNTFLWLPQILSLVLLVITKIIPPPTKPKVQ